MFTVLQKIITFDIYFLFIYNLGILHNPISIKANKRSIMKKITVKKLSAKDIAVLSLMVALTIVFCFVPISFGPITLALMILPTLIIAQVGDLKTTFALGLFMGLINYVAWFTTKAASPIAPIFQNPIVCIVPRVLIGLVSYGVRKLFEKFILKPKYVDVNGRMTLSNKKSLIALDQVSIVLATALGVVTNTLFVGLFTLAFFNDKALPSGTVIDIEYILAWFGLNFLIEVIAFSLITPALTFALRSAKLVPQPHYTKFKPVLEETQTEEDASEPKNDEKKDD